MKVTYNWLKDFVNITISPEALAEKLTMAGIEVKGIEKKDGDAVFEIEITSNRPDWLSVIGIAREVAAITGKKLSGYPVIRLSGYPVIRLSGYPARPADRQTGRPVDSLFINIQDKKDCPLYTAKIIKGVKVGPSPDWLRKRLELIGCRSINNIVDITNYVLFEYGEPLHAFDLDRIVSPSPRLPVSPSGIIIRRANNAEEITTIDGFARRLDDNILIIASHVNEKTGRPADRQTGRPADRQTGRPIAIAGIMGGKDTEVSGSTRNVLLEAAIFNPVLIRRGRQKLGLQTDSSYRFERGVDLATAQLASWRATELIEEIAGGNCVLAKTSGAPKVKPVSVTLDTKFTSRILGVNIAPKKIKQILCALGFQVKPKARNTFQVAAPAFRQDIRLEIDLIEEVARIFGYANIPTTLPSAKPCLVTGAARDLVSLVKNTLVGLGLNEAVTYGLIDRRWLKNFGQVAEPIEILNPLSQEQAVLRPTLIPGLGRAIAHNLNQKQVLVDIFEVAGVFSLSNGEPKEELVLGIAICGTQSRFSAAGLIKDKVGFLHLKGIIIALLERLGIKDYSLRPGQGGCLAEIYAGKERVGAAIKLPKEALGTLEIKNEEMFAAELSLEKILACADLQKHYTPLAVYPGVTRDISVVLREGTAAEEVLKAIKNQAGSLLREARVVDCYRGKHIPAGFKGLTISCLYRAPERTLTEAEVNPVHNAVLALLREAFAAVIR